MHSSLPPCFLLPCPSGESRLPPRTCLPSRVCIEYLICSSSLNRFSLPSCLFLRSFLKFSPSMSLYLSPSFIVSSLLPPLPSWHLFLLVSLPPCCSSFHSSICSLPSSFSFSCKPSPFSQLTHASAPFLSPPPYILVTFSSCVPKLFLPLHPPPSSLLPSFLLFTKILPYNYQQWRVLYLYPHVWPCGREG